MRWLYRRLSETILHLGMLAMREVTMLAQKYVSGQEPWHSLLTADDLLVSDPLGSPSIEIDIGLYLYQ